MGRWPLNPLIKEDMREALNNARPRAMQDYLDANGWHFNKLSAEYAASLMWKRGKDGKREYIEPITKEDLRQLLMKHKVEVDEEDIYDALYVANMCKADLMGGEDAAIEDEQHMARYVKRVVCDEDAGDGTVMARWYAGLSRAGIRPDWESMM